MISSSQTTDTAAVDAPEQEPPINLKPLEKILREFKGRRDAVMPILQRAQNTYGYLPREVLQAISDQTGIPLSRLYGVVTFYGQFHLERRGRHLIRVCDGTACHVRGAAKSIEAIEQGLGVKVGETSEDYKYTLEVVYCLGSCGLAPVAVVDDQVYGGLAPRKLVEELQALD